MRARREAPKVGDRRGRMVFVGRDHPAAVSNGWVGATRLETIDRVGGDGAACAVCTVVLPWRELTVRSDGQPCCRRCGPFVTTLHALTDPAAPWADWPEQRAMVRALSALVERLRAEGTSASTVRVGLAVRASRSA